MSSRKEEERNEKIIRGLMKLPPNRRCINCNSMGPQYVCTNFWTFVCMTCSGIHREFTHRVKSVSMAKFTSHEVEALQKGGNQSARDIYLKLWDPQRHRLPDNSNADKVREFIRNVYLDKKYVGGGSSDRPPRDLHNGRSQDEEIRRASSYHSFSQSPPYDFQYEERRYGKHVPVLTRKPGSDRGLYDGKFSSFLSPTRLSDRSPSRLSDHIYDDNFANERSDSRISDYSASSGGDPFRSNFQSPNFQRDFGSPSSETSRDFSSEDLVHFTGNPNADSPARRSIGQMLHPQRTASSGSVGSIDSMSFKSVNSVGLVDATLEHEPAEAQKGKKTTASALPQPSVSGSYDGLDLFNAPFAPETVSSSLVGSVSQLPGTASPQLIDLLQPSTTSTPTFSTCQQPQPISSSSLDMFPGTSLEPSTAILGDKHLQFTPQNGGWATFDTPQLPLASSTATEIQASDPNPVRNPLLSGQWPSFQDNSALGPSSVMEPLWNANMEKVETIPSTPSAESWNAFEDSSEKLVERKEQVSVHQSSSAHQYLSTEPLGTNKNGTPAIGMESLSSVSRVSFSPNVSLISLDSSVVFDVEGRSDALERKSTNPFDLPYDAEINSEHMSQFFEMSALQAVLPDVQAPSPFTAGANQHWFTQDTISPFVHAGPEGVLGYIAGHAQSSQISNVSSHGPLASVGGNPFA